MHTKFRSDFDLFASSVSLEGGARLKGIAKIVEENYPLVTIITATYNAVNLLPRTITSVRELTYKNIEWIVVDGNSSDETLNLIRQNEDVIDYWISETDGGIYEAWNKGAVAARGIWIAFLGAGDTYNSESIAAYIDAIQKASITPDLVSSRVQLVTDDGVILREWGDRFDWNAFKKYMNIAHVGALHHRRLFEKFGYFDTAYKSSSDYDFLMRCGAELETLHVSKVTAKMLVGGISNGYQGIKETYNIQRKYGAGAAAKVRYWIACTKRFIRPLLRNY